MTTRKISRQAKQLVSHVLDNRGYPEPKLVRAVAKAVAGSAWPHRAALLREFAKQVLWIEASQTATITSAEQLSAEDKNRIETIVKKQYPHIKEVRWDIEESLLAGIRVTAGDMWLDMSIQQRLTQIQEKLG